MTEALSAGRWTDWRKMGSCCCTSSAAANWWSWGPTECARGSHFLSNHLSNPSLVLDELIYQHAGTSPESLVKGTQCRVPESCASSMAAGSCLVFDDRILHRGLANRSDNTRHVAYFSYRRRGYFANTHFESQRSVFDTIA